MKHLMLLLFLLTAQVCIFPFEFGFSYDRILSHDSERLYFGHGYPPLDGNMEVEKSGYSIYLEIPYEVNDNYSTGLGIIYQLPRSTREDWSIALGYYSFIPVFASNVISIPCKDVSISLLCNAGYNFFVGNDIYKDGSELKGSYYLALGTGLQHKNAILKLMYEDNNGYVRTGDYCYLVNNKQVKISLGYRF